MRPNTRWRTEESLPFNALKGLGVSAAQSLQEAAAEGPYISKDEVQTRAGVSKAVIEILDQFWRFGRPARFQPDDLFLKKAVCCIRWIATNGIL